MFTGHLLIEFIPINIQFFQRFNFSIFHMIKNCDFFFQEINSKLSNLFMRFLSLISLESLSYFCNHNFLYMIINIGIGFMGWYFLGIFFYFLKSAGSEDNPIITVMIFLDNFLPDLLYPLNKSITVSIMIISDNSHPSIDFNNFLPMGHFSRAIKFHSFEFIRIPISFFKLICSMFINIAYFFNFYFLVILNYWLLTS